MNNQYLTVARPQTNISRKSLVNSRTISTEQSAEPERKNYVVLRKIQCRLERLEADRLAQDVICT
jgi:hypothetical protein